MCFNKNSEYDGKKKSEKKIEKKKNENKRDEKWDGCKIKVWDGPLCGEEKGFVSCARGR